MSTRTIRKFWLEPDLIFRGAEGEGEGAGGPGTGSNDEGSTGGNAGGDENAEGAGDSDDDGDDEPETFSKEDVAALRKALKEERTARKVAERAARAKDKGVQDAAAKDEKEKADERLRAAEEKATRLAEGFRAARVEAVIMRLATAANVISPEDMVALLKSQGYKDIEIDQDEDNPGQVEIDEDDVKNAIKRALKTRAHWVKKTGEEEEGRSGSPFRPGGQRKPDLDDEALKADYPALRNRR
jgi:hypothetical protein